MPCFSCRSDDVHTVLDLGRQPIANELPASYTPEQDRFPLALVVCAQCSLAQIDYVVPPERLFSDYVYRSSFSDAMLRHVADLAGRMVEDKTLGPDSLVVEAASNDGYLLKNYVARGVPVLGVEPADNIAEIARSEAGVPTLSAFFNQETGKRIASDVGRCDVFHAHNVVAHVPEPNSFMAGVCELLKPDGVAVIEAPYVLNLIDGRQFDTIYHEHFSYFGCSAMAALAERNGLTLTAVEPVAVHGGSMRYFLRLAPHPVAASCTQALAVEREREIANPASYREFAADVRRVLDDLADFLRSARSEGRSVAAYGASAKGSTLLNALPADAAATIAFAVDRSTLKQGRYMPALDIPIFAPEELLRRQPDYTVLLTWNFADEILAQQQSYRDRGGKFIVPAPTLTVL